MSSNLQQYFIHPQSAPADNEQRQRLICGLDELLRTARPKQVDPGQTVTVAERDSAYFAIIPHRQLTGVSLICALFSDTFEPAEGPYRVRISWGQIHSLKWHDELDSAVLVGTIVSEGNEDWLNSALSRIEQELNRDIIVKVFTPSSSEYPCKAEFYLDLGGRVSRIGRSRLRRRNPSEFFGEMRCSESVSNMC